MEAGAHHLLAQDEDTGDGVDSHQALVGVPLKSQVENEIITLSLSLNTLLNYSL